MSKWWHVDISWGYWHRSASISHCRTKGLHRLLHSPSLVAIGLSVRNETWPPIVWHHLFVIGWSKYRLGLPSAPLRYGLMWPVGISTIFQTPLTVPLHSPNGRQLPELPAVRAVQGDCEEPTVCLHALLGNDCLPGCYLTPRSRPRTVVHNHGGWSLTEVHGKHVCVPP